MHSIQHYVIKFVSDLQKVAGFLQFPPPIKTDCLDIIEILLKVALNPISPFHSKQMMSLRSFFLIISPFLFWLHDSVLSPLNMYVDGWMEV